MLRQEHVWGWQSALIRQFVSCRSWSWTDLKWSHVEQFLSRMLCYNCNTHLWSHNITDSASNSDCCCGVPCTICLSPILLDATLACQAERDHLTVCATLIRPASTSCPWHVWCAISEGSTATFCRGDGDASSRHLKVLCLVHRAVVKITAPGFICA